MTGNGKQNSLKFRNKNRNTPNAADDWWQTDWLMEILRFELVDFDE